MRTLATVSLLACLFWPTASLQGIARPDTPPTTQQLIQAVKAAKEAAKQALKEAKEEESKANEALRERREALKAEIAAIDKELGENTVPIPVDPSANLSPFAKTVCILAKAVPVYPNKSAMLDSLASVYSLAEAKIRLVLAGGNTPELQGYATPSQIVTSTGREVVKVLGNDVNNWRIFFTNLQAELKTLSASGNLNGLEAHANIWKQIAEGLKAAK